MSAPAAVLRAAAIAFLPLLASLPLHALDWPVQKHVVTGTFGENRGDHLHNGIDIGGGDQEVYPVLPGELVFRYDEAADYSSLPRGMGTFVVLAHSQDLLTIYGHLASGSLGPPRARYDVSDRIGVIGDTGHADGKHLHFSVYDQETGAALNPLAFLPPVPDRQPPVIKRVLLAAANLEQTLENGTSVRAGRAEVRGEVYDQREDVQFNWPLAPYSVTLALDGKEVSRIVFDSLLVRDGRMALGTVGVNRGDLYAAGGLLRCGVVDLRPGASRLRITARDYVGNETVREMALTVGQ